MATAVLDLDFADGPPEVDELEAYRSAFVLVRWRGRPLGRIWVDVKGGRIERAALWSAAAQAHSHAVARAYVEELLPLEQRPPARNGALAPCSVIICTRNRTEDLERCLDSLRSAVAADVEIIVVDNAPSDDRTQELAARYPVRYVREMRPGLNWARSRGAREARGEILIYTDDDVVASPGWVDQMREPFAAPYISAVTGLVMPFELATEAQEWFEHNIGFARGFERREHTRHTLRPIAAANVGAGASMAFRRALVIEGGLFEIELDGGTAAQSGGDTYAFYRLLRDGGCILYNPQAVTWHKHRRDAAALHRMLYGYSVGTYVYLLRCLVDHRDFEAIYAGWWWLRYHILRQLWHTLRRRPGAVPLRLAAAELQGCFAALSAYRQSRRDEQTRRKLYPL